MSPPARLFTASFGFLVGAHFLASLGFASMLLLPLYLDWLGASRADIGALMAAASISGLLTRPLVAWALDAVGRKPTLMLGCGIGAAGLGLVWFVRDVGLTAWGMRLLFGVGEGAMFSAFFTFVADLVPASRRTEGIALFGVSGLLPLAVSPVATSVGINPPDLQWFLPLVGVAVACSALFLIPLPETRIATPREGLSLRAALAGLITRPTWSVWLGTALFSGMASAFMAFATVVAADRGAETPTALWLTYALGAAGVRVVGARLPDRVGPANLVAPSLAIYALALILASRAQSDAAFLVVGGMAGLGHGYCFPVLSTQVVNRVPERYRGTGLSFFTALFGLTALLSSPALGWLADRYGDAWMFSALSLAAAAGIATWALLERGAYPVNYR
jgi:MFS family permease